MYEQLRPVTTGSGFSGTVSFANILSLGLVSTLRLDPLFGSQKYNHQGCASCLWVLFIPPVSPPHLRHEFPGISPTNGRDQQPTTPFISDAKVCHQQCQLCPTFAHAWPSHIGKSKSSDNIGNSNNKTQSSHLLPASTVQELC